jgi:hypothetical protein
LKAAAPLHAVAALVAPAQLDLIQLSRIAAETTLAMAYHKQGDRPATDRQVDLTRRLIGQLERSPPAASGALAPWALWLVIEIARRELARLEPTDAAPLP